MKNTALKTSAHALLSVFAANGMDRIFLVPGESYLGLLDALNDFRFDVVTCRHEAGAGFMACADGRLTRRPAIVMVSRGPGASNAAIALHAAQQDAIPLILVIGQIPKAHLRREAFQEIDYQQMYGTIAKWVAEPTDPAQLAEIASKAVRIAISGTPGPVVIAIPEDIQQQVVLSAEWEAVGTAVAEPDVDVVRRVHELLVRAQRPLVVAGGAYEASGGREALLRFAEAWQLPVAVSFRRHDVFPNRNSLYVGELGLANSEHQLDALRGSDLILALGTRYGDVTSQGYTFPRMPKPQQPFVHCYPDDHIVGLHYSPDVALVCDPVALAAALTTRPSLRATPQRSAWLRKLRAIFEARAAWPQRDPADGVDFTRVVRAVYEQAPRNAMVCLDAGTFAAPVYRHFQFMYPQRLMAPVSGAMGYGTPAAVACALRHPERKVICMVGDGGFMMTGNEMIAAVERKLPILFILANNNCYASIRIHQDRQYPGRHVGTSLFNPDFARNAAAFGMRTEVVERAGEIDAAIARGLAAQTPYFIEVKASLAVTLP